MNAIINVSLVSWPFYVHTEHVQVERGWREGKKKHKHTAEYNGRTITAMTHVGDEMHFNENKREYWQM